MNYKVQPSNVYECSKYEIKRDLEWYEIINEKKNIYKISLEFLNPFCGLFDASLIFNNITKNIL